MECDNNPWVGTSATIIKPAYQKIRAEQEKIRSGPLPNRMILTLPNRMKMDLSEIMDFCKQVALQQASDLFPDVVGLLQNNDSNYDKILPYLDTIDKILLIAIACEKIPTTAAKELANVLWRKLPHQDRRKVQSQKKFKSKNSSRDDFLIPFFEPDKF